MIVSWNIILAVYKFIVRNVYYPMQANPGAIQTHARQIEVFREQTCL